MPPIENLGRQTPEIREGLDRMVAIGGAMLRTHPAWVGDRDPELVAMVVFHSLRGALFRIVATAPDKLDDPQLVDLLFGGARGFLVEPQDLQP